MITHVLPKKCNIINFDIDVFRCKKYISFKFLDPSYPIKVGDVLFFERRGKNKSIYFRIKVIMTDCDYNITGIETGVGRLVNNEYVF
jgi:hypothetical protein